MVGGNERMGLEEIPSWVEVMARSGENRQDWSHAGDKEKAHTVGGAIKLALRPFYLIYCVAKQRAVFYLLPPTVPASLLSAW